MPQGPAYNKTLFESLRQCCIFQVALCGPYIRRRHGVHLYYIILRSQSALSATMYVKGQFRVTNTRPSTERKVSLTPDTTVAIYKNDDCVSSFV